jgi:hypothetical protein
MWTNYRVVAADNLLEGRTNRMIFFNQTQYFQTQSKTSINDTSITSEQPMWDEEGMSLSRVNAEYNYSRQLTLNTIIAKQKCDDQIRMRGRRFCFARDNR